MEHLLAKLLSVQLGGRQFFTFPSFVVVAVVLITSVIAAVQFVRVGAIHISTVNASVWISSVLIIIGLSAKTPSSEEHQARGEYVRWVWMLVHILLHLLGCVHMSIHVLSKRLSLRSTAQPDNRTVDICC